MQKVSAVFSGSGTAVLEAIGPDNVVIARHPVAFVNGANEWLANVSFPELHVPAGGRVYIRAAGGNNVRYTGGTAAKALSTAGFDQATAVGQTQAWGVTDIHIAVRIEYEALAVTLSDMVGPSFSPTLFDEGFDTASGWTLAGATLAGGRLVSAESASWANACIPAFYGRSQLMRRTLTAYAEVVAANQVWGIGFIRDTGGTTLDTPLVLIHGRTNQLFIYKWNGSAAPAGAAAESPALPWDVVGSRMRIDIKRQWFATTVTVTNLRTGQSLQRVLDYTLGTGGDTGRPWGRPCVVFPGTSAGGVLIDRMRMVADFPFPTARAARVLMIGDSITEGSVIGGTPYPEHNKVWSHLVEDERLAKGERDAVVMGRGGQISSHAVNAMHEATALCDSNTVVVILLGTNDVLTSSTRDAWRTNMAAIVAALRTRTTRISLACLPPINTAGTPMRNQLNEDIVAMYFGQDLLPPVRFDLALSADSDGVTWGAGMHSGDGVHPSVIGNAAMLERLRLDLPEAFE